MEKIFFMFKKFIKSLFFLIKVFFFLPKNAKFFFNVEKWQKFLANKIYRNNSFFSLY